MHRNIYIQVTHTKTHAKLEEEEVVVVVAPF